MPKKIWLDRLEATRPYQRLRYAMNRELISFLQQQVFAGRSGLQIAEVACGSGYAAHLAAQQKEVSLSMAADLNMEDFIQAAIPDYRATFVLMDIFKPAAKQGSLDLVWNSSSVEELDQPEQAIKAMAWLVKPGGSVFVGVPSRSGPAGWLRSISSKRTQTWLGRVYNRSELSQLFTSAGLRVRHETSYLFGTFIGALAEKTA